MKNQIKKILIEFYNNSYLKKSKDVDYNFWAKRIEEKLLKKLRKGEICLICGKTKKEISTSLCDDCLENLCQK